MFARIFDLLVAMHIVSFGFKEKTQKKKRAVAAKAAPPASSEEEDMIPVSFVSLLYMVNIANQKRLYEL